MNPLPDGEGEMNANELPDEVAVEALLKGRPLDPELAPMAGLIEDLRSLAQGPPPAPSAALASVLSDGLTEAAGSPAGRADKRSKTMGTRSGLLAKLAGMTMAAKIALGTGVAVAAVGAAAVGGLPEGPVLQDPGNVSQVVDEVPGGNTEDALEDIVGGVPTTVPGVGGDDDEDEGAGGGSTTTTTPGGTSGGGSTPTSEPKNHGACVSQVARDRSLQGREHGQAVSQMAKSDCGKVSSTTSTPTDTGGSLNDDDQDEEEVEAQNRGPGNGHGHGNGNGNGNGNGRGRGPSGR